MASYRFSFSWLTLWGRVTHICVSKLTSIGSDNGLSPGRRQAIIWTNAGILLIGPLGTNFNEILIEIHPFSFTKMHLKISSAKWRPFCLGHNVLNCFYLWHKVFTNVRTYYTRNIFSLSKTLLGHKYTCTKQVLTFIFNTLRPRWNGCDFAEDIFKCIFVNENVKIAITISLKFVHKGSISNIPALVQKMAWHRTGDMSLSEPMMS